MASQAEINLMKGVMTQGKIPFRLQFNVAGLLGGKDVHDVALVESEG